MGLIQFIISLARVEVVPDPPPDEEILMGDTETLWGDEVITFED